MRESLGDDCGLRRDKETRVGNGQCFYYFKRVLMAVLVMDSVFTISKGF